jgi:hypothetical protein
MQTVVELFQAVVAGARELNTMSDCGALHIFVADGNCDDESIEFCLAQPNLTDVERDFANRMAYLPEETRYAIYAFAQCSDIDAALAPPPQT